MNKICTDIPQSKKLIELGVDVDTSDMVYLRSYFEDEGEYNLLVGSYHEGYMEKDDGTIIPVFDEHIPAWSLTALIDILPNTITDEDGTLFGLNIKKNFIEYYNPSMGALYATYHSIIAEDLVDAAFEMICWLKENNKI